MIPQRTKRCPNCNRTLPWNGFYVRTRWENGDTRTVSSWCRDCMNQRAAEQQRVQRQAAMRDPDERERWLERNREKNATYRRKQGVNPHPDRCMRPKSRNDPEFLPLAPFSRWVSWKLESTGLDISEFAKVIGVHERRVRAWLNPVETRRGGRKYTTTRIHLATADRVFVAFGDPFVLYEVWPHLATPDPITKPVVVAA